MGPGLLTAVLLGTAEPHHDPQGGQSSKLLGASRGAQGVPGPYRAPACLSPGMQAEEGVLLLPCVGPGSPFALGFLRRLPSDD